MLIFTDLDGTLFDTDINQAKNIFQWIEEFSNAKPQKNATKIIKELHDAGHEIMALTSRGVDLGDVGNDIHKITCASILKNFPPQTIIGVKSSVRYKYNSILNILNHVNLKKDYKLENDIVLIDDDIEQIALSVMGGIKSILFKPPKDFNKDLILKLSNGVENAEKKIKDNLKIASNWDEVAQIINDWNKTLGIEETANHN